MLTITKAFKFLQISLLAATGLSVSVNVHGDTYALGGDLSGTIEISGPFPTDGTFNFTSEGTPAISASATVTASRELFGSFSNLPNHNDRFVISSGLLTAMKYDFYTSELSLALNTDNTFIVRDNNLTLISTGSYGIQQTGDNTFSFTGGLIRGSFQFDGSLAVDGTFPFASDGDPLSQAQIVAMSGEAESVNEAPLFINLPNHNDQYRVNGGTVNGLKYDFYEGTSTLYLLLDGTFSFSEDSTSEPELGSYTITPVILEVPEISIHRAHIFRFETIAGVTYELESSPDLITFTPTGLSIVGDGGTKEFTVEATLDSEFYRVSLQ